jgi:hypothetical protein
MHKELEEMVREHQEAQGEFTGFFLVTFKDGAAVVSGHARNDDLAAEIIGALSDALGEGESEPAHGRDTIGECWGHA